MSSDADFCIQCTSQYLAHGARMGQIVIYRDFDWIFLPQGDDFDWLFSSQGGYLTIVQYLLAVMCVRSGTQCTGWFVSQVRDKTYWQFCVSSQGQNLLAVMCVKSGTKPTSSSVCHSRTKPTGSSVCQIKDKTYWQFCVSSQGQNLLAVLCVKSGTKPTSRSAHEARQWLGIITVEAEDTILPMIMTFKMLFRLWPISVLKWLV